MNPKMVKILLLFIAALLILPYGISATDIVKGGVGIRIGSPTNKCANTLSSCGTFPDCVNLTGIVYCVNGRVVKPYCYSNTVKNKTYNAACDSSTQINSVNFQLNITNGAGSNRQLIVTLLSAGTADVINTTTIDGYGSVSSLENVVDFKFEYDNSNLNVIVKNLNLTNLNSKVSSIIVDKPTPTIPNTSVYKAYKVELPSYFVYSSILLAVNYNGVTVNNENNLRFYKCSSFDTTTNTCSENWMEITSVTRNTTSKTISTEINSFSVYVLGEPAQQNITDNTTNNTTNNESSTCDPNTWEDCPCICGECGSCQGIQTNDCGDTRICSKTCGFCSPGYTCINNICTANQVSSSGTTTQTTQTIAQTNNTTSQQTNVTQPNTSSIEKEKLIEQQNTSSAEEQTKPTENTTLNLISMYYMILGAPAALLSYLAMRKFYSQRVVYYRPYVKRFKRVRRPLVLKKNTKSFAKKKNKFGSDFEETRLVLE
jgi:hypothetical protein